MVLIPLDSQVGIRTSAGRSWELVSSGLLDQEDGAPMDGISGLVMCPRDPFLPSIA